MKRRSLQSFGVIVIIMLNGLLVGRSAVAGVTGGANHMGFELYAYLSKQTGNIVIAPGALAMNLALMHAGAHERTAAQIAQVLHLSDHSDTIDADFAEFSKQLRYSALSGCDLIMANSLWKQHDLPYRQEFHAIARDYHDAALKSVNFADVEATRRAMNDWVSTETHQMIQRIDSSRLPRSETQFVLASAIYFRGDWDKPFEESRTKNGKFVLSATDSIDVPMMSRTDTFGYAETSTCQMLEMPYRSNVVSMLVLLPKGPELFGELEGMLNFDEFERISKKLKQEGTREVKVYFPRFSCSTVFDLRSQLKEMGLTDAFDPTHADFSAVTGERGLYMETVLHQARMDVNEKGTEAAAATFGFSLLGPGGPPVFVANHPFIFIIRHNPTGAILFLGRVMNPLK